MALHPETSGEFHTLLGRLGGEAALEAAARQHKAFLRPRGVKSACDLLRLLLMYAVGGMSLRTVAAVAAESGLADVSDVALLQRFRGAADWMEALCSQVLGLAAQVTAQPHAAALSAQSITLVDASIITAPGRGTAYRLHMNWSLQHQRMAAAAITTLEQGERLDRLRLAPGTLGIGDRGYPQPNGLRNTLQAGAHVLVRVTWNSLNLTDPQGAKLDWPTLAAAAAHGPVDVPVLVRKARGPFEPLALRLVMIAKPPAEAARARQQAQRNSQRGQSQTTDPRTLACADHLMLLTSLAADTAPPDQLAALYRSRWQIELAFKRMKSLLHMDRLPAKDPGLARAWLHAHLLVALLADDAVAQSDAISP